MLWLSKLYPQKIFSTVSNFLQSDPFSILSFDCGTRALGVCWITMNSCSMMPDLDKILQYSETLELKVRALEFYTKLVNVQIDNIIKIKYIDVWDLLPGCPAGTTLCMSTAAKELRHRLDKLSKQFGYPDSVLYEYQMSVNDKSRTVSHFLQFYYCVKCPVFNIGGGEKNQLTLSPELTIQEYYSKYSDAYYARKIHAKDSLYKYLNTFGITDIISLVPKKSHRDCADAFMQTLAAIKITGSKITAGKITASKIKTPKIHQTLRSNTQHRRRGRRHRGQIHLPI